MVYANVGSRWPSTIAIAHLLLDGELRWSLTSQLTPDGIVYHLELAEKILWTVAIIYLGEGIWYPKESSLSVNTGNPNA